MKSAGSDDATPPDATTSDATTSGDTTSDDTADAAVSGGRLSPALIATLVAVPVMVIVGFIAFAALRPDAVNPVETYDSAGTVPAECGRLLAEVPQTFDGYGDKQVTEDRATWPATGSGDDITLRCGVTRPDELAPTSNLQEIHASGQAGVQWFITDTVDGAGQAYVSVDHRPYVAMWVPTGAGNGPITDVSGVIDRVLERGPLDFG